MGESGEEVEKAWAELVGGRGNGRFGESGHRASDAGWRGDGSRRIFVRVEGEPLFVRGDARGTVLPYRKECGISIARSEDYA